MAGSAHTSFTGRRRHTRWMGRHRRAATSAAQVRPAAAPRTRSSSRRAQRDRMLSAAAGGFLFLAAAPPTSASASPRQRGAGSGSQLGRRGSSKRAGGRRRDTDPRSRSASPCGPEASARRHPRSPAGLAHRASGRRLRRWCRRARDLLSLLTIQASSLPATEGAVRAAESAGYVRQSCASLQATGGLSRTWVDLGGLEATWRR
jgi:hypothetical protein